jgi:hypothetical protein
VLGAAAGRGGGGFGRGPAAAPPRDACNPNPAAPPQQAAGGRGGRGGGRGAVQGLQPGDYSIRLTVDGQTYTQPVTLKPDPRGVPAGASEAMGGDDK